ncbi:hypothetical protein ACKWTF_013135 [Chironomus riparius]
MKVVRSAFELSLKIVKFYGIYQVNPSTLSVIRGLLMFSFIVLQFLIASLYRFSDVSDLNEFIVGVIYVIFSLNLAIKLMSFRMNQNQIIDLIEEIEALDNGIDTNMIKDENEKILKINTLLVTSEMSIGFNLSLSILMLSNEHIFTIPMLYYPKCDEAYYMLFAIHFLQIYGLGTISVGNFFFVKCYYYKWKDLKVSWTQSLVFHNFPVYR